MDVIRELCSFENRLAGTDAERRAAEPGSRSGCATRGRRVEVEPIHVHPQCRARPRRPLPARRSPAAWSRSSAPPAGFAIVLSTAVSMYLDLNARLYLLRRLFFRRASQNVVSPGPRTDAPARLFLCAHLDAARTGAVFRPAYVRRLARRLGRPRFPSAPSASCSGRSSSLLPILGARMVGIDSP